MVDLRLHPTERKYAGSQPSFSLSRSGGDSPSLVERDDGGEVDEEVQDPLQQCSHLQGKAAPGVADAELPWRLPLFSLQLIDEVNQVESAELKEKLGMMKKRKTWR